MHAMSRQHRLTQLNSRGISLLTEKANDLGFELLIAQRSREGTLDEGVEVGVVLLLGMSTATLVHALDDGLGSFGSKGGRRPSELARGDEGTSARHGSRLEGRGRREAREHEEGGLAVHDAQQFLLLQLGASRSGVPFLWEGAGQGKV